MTVAMSPTGKPTSIGVVEDTDLEDTVNKNVRAGASTLYYAYIEKPNDDPDEQASLKLYDSTGEAIVVGTDKPDIVLPCPDNDYVEMLSPSGLPFVYGISMACIQEDGWGGSTQTKTTSATIVRLAAS